MTQDTRSRKQILAYRIIGICCLVYPLFVLLIFFGMLFGILFIFPTIALFYEFETPTINLLDWPFLILLLTAGIGIVAYSGFNRSSYFEDWDNWLGGSEEKDDALFDLAKYKKRLDRHSTGLVFLGSVFLILVIWTFILYPLPEPIWFVVFMSWAVLIAGMFIVLGFLKSHELKYHAEESFKNARMEANIE